MRSNASLHGRADFNKLKITHFGIGGDFLLKDWSKRLAESETRQREGDRERQAQNPPEGGFSSSKREPGKSPGEKGGGRQVGSASSVDGESAFTGAQSSQSLSRRGLNIFKRKISEDEKAGRVGMSGHGAARIFFGEEVKCGMFERVIAAGLQNKRKIEN